MEMATRLLRIHLQQLNKVNIEKTPVKIGLVKTGDATRVLSYGVILLGSASSSNHYYEKKKSC